MSYSQAQFEKAVVQTVDEDRDKYGISYYEFAEPYTVKVWFRTNSGEAPWVLEMVFNGYDTVGRYHNHHHPCIAHTFYRHLATQLYAYL